MKLKLILYFLMISASASMLAQVNEYFEIVAHLDQGPGNIAVSKTGRIFLTMHQAYNPEIKIVEVGPEGTLKPFPNVQWNQAPNADGLGIASPLGIQVDKNDVLWTIDNGSITPKIIAWDINTLKVHKVITIPFPIVGEKSFVNDLAIDLKNNAIYLADMLGDEGPALIIIDIDSGSSRRVLDGHKSTLPSRNARIKIDDDTTINKHNHNILNGLNPITIEPKNQWVYFGAMNNTILYRIATKHLLNKTLKGDELAKYVEIYGKKAVSDGITIDDTGNVYITDLNGKGIGVTYPDGEYELLFSHNKLLWPDSLSTGPGGYIYGVVNQLHRSTLLNSGTNDSKPPYLLIRFKALSSVSIGR